MDTKEIMTGKRIYLSASAACLAAVIVLQILYDIRFIYKDGAVSPVLFMLLLILFLPYAKQVRHKLLLLGFYALVTGIPLLMAWIGGTAGPLFTVLYLVPALYIVLCAGKRVNQYFVKRTGR